MKKALILALTICIILPAIYIWKNKTQTAENKTVLKIFHAGSLAAPFEEAEKLYEAAHPDVDVQREQMGSVKAVRQITDLHREADIIAVADYSLIPKMMYPEYANWYILFARNEMVLVYNKDKSKYADSINQENWYEILRKKDVTLGFSNPNLDPCGYRSLMVLQLAELYYNDTSILDDIVLENSAIKEEFKNGTYIITAPEDLNPNTQKLTIRSKSVELISLVEEGGLDYAFEYRSVAVQHNLSYITLPKQINLGFVEMKDSYAQVKVRITGGKEFIGSPIVYGITIPLNAPHKQLAVEFIKLIITQEGQSILESCGQPPITPAIGVGAIPDEIKSFIKPG